jgi:hypothetical protein
MSHSRTEEPASSPLDLPPEYEDLTGLLELDLQAVAGVLTQRAHERLLLTRREYHQLYHKLVRGMAEAINETLEPLTIDCR